MELSYLNPTKSLIVAHLGAGETLGTLTEGTGYIKHDAADGNFLALLEIDPTLETVVDPGAVRMPPAAEPTPEQQKMIDESAAAVAAAAKAAAPADHKPAAAAAPAKPAAPAAKR